MEISFTAVVVPSTNLASKQYVSVGVLYDSETFLWVGQQEITTSPQTETFTNTGQVLNIPSSLALGQHDLIELELTITQPFTDLSVSAFNSLGYEDTLHLGDPVAVLGGSFSCSEASKWEVVRGQSISRKSVGKIDLSYKNLMNLDMSHSSSNSANKVNIKIPITAMAEATPGQYAFTVGMEIGTDTVVSSTQDITITDQTLSLSPSSGSTTGTAYPLNSPLYPGGSAAFVIWLSVPAGETFQLKVIGSISHTVLGVYIHEAGLCAGFNSLFLLSSGNSYDADFGTITNVDSSPTTVKVALAFKLDPAVSPGSILETVQIDGKDYTLTGTIEAAPAVGEVTGTGEGLGPTSFNTMFGAGMRNVLTIPATVLDKQLTFMTYAEPGITEFDVRVCRLEVEDVGLGLPCTYPNQDPLVAGPRTVYSKSSADRLFDDVGKIELGSTCPADISSIENSRQLAISFIYEIPPQTVPSVNYKLNGGLYVDQTALWTSSYSLTTSATEVTDVEGWNSQTLLTPYLTARTDHTTVKISQPFPVRFVMKLSPYTRGSLQFKVKSGANAAICKIKVLQIGRNLACAQKPEGFSDKYFQTSIFYQKRHQLDGEARLVFDGLTNYGSREMQTNMFADDDSIELEVYFTAIGNVTLQSEVNSVSKSVEIGAVEEKPESGGSLDFQFVKIPSTDDNTLYLKTSKTVGILIDVPVDYNSLVRVKFADKSFSELVNFCSIIVTRVGSNLPCINQQQRAIFPNKTESSLLKLDDNGNPRAYKELYLDLTVCYYPHSDDLQENQFQLELNLRPSSKAAGGETVTIEAVTNVGGAETSKEITLQISAAVPDFVTADNTSYAEVLQNSTTPIYAAPGEKVWVPFNITVPREATIPLELAVLTQNLPDAIDRNGDDVTAVLTLHDVRLSDEGAGINVCCLNSLVDPFILYDPTFLKTENLTTFMQMDSLTMNLGYVTNKVFAFRSELRPGLRSVETTYLLQARLQSQSRGHVHCGGACPDVRPQRDTERDDMERQAGSQQWRGES